MFKTEEKSTFKYWFAHWCAFQMTALNLHIWKFRHLFHDWGKPWMFYFLYGAYSEYYPKVRKWHRNHNNHHIEWLGDHNMDDFDIDSFIIDNECSRFTKEDSPVPAKTYFTDKYKESKKLWGEQAADEFNSNLYKQMYIYHKALARIKELGL